MPKLCEKCGTYDPTPAISADSRCPGCGVIYAKLTRPRRAAVSNATAGSANAESNPIAGWPPIRRLDVWFGLAAAGLLFVLALIDEDGFILLLDHTNLAFHEAGHLFFGILGNAPGLYGGTLGQLVFPIVCIVSFWQRRHAVGLSLSGVWLFENFLNIARYMADARAQILPLVGGGEHDWYHIFTRWGLLEHDTDVALITRAFGWIGMIGCVAWLWRQHRIQGAGLR